MAEGVRIKQAREFRGLTQTELADRVGIGQSAVAQIEAGRIWPSSEVMEAIAFQTGFPLSFFKQEPFTDFSLGSLVFRARKAMTAKERAQVYRHGEVIYEGVARMAARVETGPLRIPRLASPDFESPEQAAVLTRIALGLSPDTPIPNLLNTVERAGAFVIGLPLQAKDAVAYSLWADTRPVIVIFQGVLGDRLRFSVAHELGHLVMHQSLPRDEKQREQEAHAFAGELLMPESAAQSELIPPITLTELAQLKPRWGMAISALIMRARHLGLITPRQTKYLFQQISQRGWRTREPANLDIPVEKPRAMRKMAELLYGDPPDYRRLASELNLPLALIRNVIEGSAVVSELPRVGPMLPTGVATEQSDAPDNVRDLAAHRRQRA